MDATVLAAYIAAGASLVTLTVTALVQRASTRATSKDNEKTLEQQRDQLNQTLAEQREHLDRTLAEQSRQLERTLAEQRTRTLNERFATAAGQLGSNTSAICLAGVYAMAGLADDWEESRQTCVDVLCAYLRLPYDDASIQEQLALEASREVRHTVIRVIAAHLKEGAKSSWQGLNLDFTGVVFDGGDFDGAQFSGGVVDFRHARFSGGEVRFLRARFSGCYVDFRYAEFSAGTVDFRLAEFSGGTVDFRFAEFFGGEVRFDAAKFSGATVSFAEAKFSGATVHFSGPRYWTVPPVFPWTGTPPAGVTLPKEEDQPQA